MTIEHLLALQAFMLEMADLNPPKEDIFEDIAAALGELLARRRVEEARQERFLKNPDYPYAD
jgi:hypothetical protein